MFGRDKDPKTIKDINFLTLSYRKFKWIILTLPGLRFMTKLIYPKSTISYFKTKGAVAFTIDDGFCGIDNPNGCMLKEILKLFKKYNAHATFFITGSHCEQTSRKDIEKLFNHGHELANHNMMDWQYTGYSEEEFQGDLQETENILNKFRQKQSKWYRAPFGRINKTMNNIITKYKMTHVVSDAFANDTEIPDPYWISKFILKRVNNGSIILIHMPEKGVREWNFNAIKMTLEGLKNMNLKNVNLTELSTL